MEKINSNITPLEQINKINGIIDEIQPATNSSTGVVQPDNVSIVVEDGVISSLAGTPPDQTFDGTSPRAQSGVAVNQAITAVNQVVNTKADKASFQVVSALPANPDANTFYFIPE
jgi:hypothetical protein